MTSIPAQLPTLRTTGHFWKAALLSIGLHGCGGADEPTAAPGVARLEVNVTSLSLVVGDSRGLTAAAFDARGNAVPTASISWQSSDASVASVAPSGLVIALGAGKATATASAGNATASVAIDVTPVRVSKLSLVLGATEVLLGGTLAARYTAVDAAGAEISGWTPKWSLSDSSIARVDNSGAITPLRAGSTTLRLRVDTATAEQSIRVHGSLDVRIAGLTFAQVVQNDSGTVPMIRGGGLPVVANVFVTANAPVAPRVWVHVSCAQGGVTRWEDSARVEVVVDSIPNPLAPAVQLLMPNEKLTASMGCVAQVDAASMAPDSALNNNRFPRVGERSLVALEVPALDITFIPIVLSADGGATGNVNEGNVDQYLMTARQVLPLARISPRVGAALTTSTLFAGGGDAAWRAILREVEAKRVLDGYRGHYYGVVRPGTGITFLQFGGFGFVSGRTAVSVQVNWFTREAQARETVAHELGHNFGRPHAPCGGPANPDASYPYTEALIGARGWDVYGAPSFGPVRVSAVPSETRDLMSYCRPIWISDYNYVRMIGGREQLASASGDTPVGEGILVRGEVDDRVTSIDPLFRVEQAASLSAAEGVDLELLDENGRVITRFRTALLVPDHGGPGSFAAVVPTSSGRAVRAVRARLSRGGVSGTRQFDPGAGDGAISVERSGLRTTLRWDPVHAADVLVRDDATSEVLAFGRGGRLTFAGSPARMRVSLSDGSRPRVFR